MTDTSWWAKLAPAFATDLAGIAPTTWVELARMARASRFPTDQHRTVYDTWKERAGRHLSEAGTAPARSTNVTPIPKLGKGRPER